MSAFSNMAKRFADGNLIVQILIGIVLGAIVGFWTNNQAFEYNELIKAGVTDTAKLLAAKKEFTDFANSLANSIAILGNLFVGALK
ncbi:MAG: serine/threonine transporter SstT, partial [Campylobacter sp.]|nr:serine/threonine transporter SstT [Campylobacter sp.]